jgi:CRISPR-associated endonuclease/helicase Cas3
VKYKFLLAKRSASPEAPQPHETLVGHVLDVVAVAITLVRERGGDYLIAMGLPEDWRNRLLAASACGALLHDLGKASHQFQRLVRPGPKIPQALRHELLSLFLLIRFADLRDWLGLQDDRVATMAAMFAAVGHHLEFPDGSASSPRDGSGDDKILVLSGHPDMATLLKEGGERLGLSTSPRLSDVEIDLLADDPLPGLNPWILNANGWWEGATPEEKRFVALVKAIVLSADLAGSALPRKGVTPVPWVQEVLKRTCKAEELEQLAAVNLRDKPIRSFQIAVAQSSARIALVRAGCGSGKTTAAYLWAARQALGRKLFFCYPTTGTATQGFQDYALADGVAIDSALVHSRAEVDLESVLGAPDAEDDQLRFEALAGWDVPLVVCTVDAVLGLMQNNRRGLFAFPSIADAAFVFDEVHGYDERLYGSLMRFLAAFPAAPVLLMTASLQQSRLEMLHRAAADLGQQLTEVEGPREFEQLKRYKLELSDLNTAWSQVEDVIKQGGRVLWVANTVDRAVRFGQEAKDRGLDPVFLYHSRFRYIDRIARHRATIGAFDSRRRGPVLAIATQVCEVSLNISADVMVTDLAPAPALIQRLGRLNRYAQPEVAAKPAPALVLEPESAAPYDGAELAVARSWLARLGGGPLSQADLAAAFLETDTAAVSMQSTRSAWLDGGPFSAIAPLREAGMTIPVIRAEDAWRAQEDRREVIKLSIPMLLGPVAREITSWDRLGIARVAPLGRINYSKEWGAAWQR